MHIKRVEICGFKSFVDRTVIHFDHDVIGIVGPNGCGKSNVVDAIRWAMGEQSAKALRGRAMADVIFGGSDTRQPHGFAEVTLSFDNTDSEGAQLLPLEYRDYAEIGVTRRLFRDGTSEYLINKTQVRLRDVTDVFLGTGVGRRAYSIIEQGKIGLIVSARPEDRRVLVEEAAGITKYKARKRQAETKMHQTRQNLVRVEDLVAEIERQLASLKRQAAKARRYLRYREEMDDLVLWEASHQWLELTATIGVAARARAEAAEATEAERARVDAKDADVEVMRTAVQSAEQRAEQSQNAAFLADNEVREVEARTERAQDRLRHLDQGLKAAGAEQRELGHKAERQVAERDGLAAELDGIETERAREQAVVQGEADKLGEAEKAHEQAAERLLALRGEQAEHAAEQAAAEATLHSFDRRRQETQHHQQRHAQELDKLQGEVAELGTRREQLCQKVQELRARRGAMCDARDALEKELPALQEHIGRGEVALDEERAKLHRDRSRLRALEEIAERMEGLGVGVQNLLRTGDGSLTGLLADRIEVPAELTAALAGLVGNRLQCVIVDDTERALGLLRQLAEARGGRATVIPAEPRGRSEIEEVDWNEEGVRGPVIDHIRFRPEDEPVLRALVGHALLVDTPAHGQRLSASGVDCDIVALDGTVFHADGRITGGSADSLAAGILERKREMRDLEQAVARQDKAFGAALTEHQERRERLTKLREALDQAKAEAHDAEIALLGGEQDQRRIEERLAVVDRQCDRVRADVEDLARTEQTTSDEQIEAERVLRESRAALERVGATLLEAERESQQCEERLAAQRQVTTERQVLFAQVQERALASRGALERVDRARAELQDRIDTLEAERDAAAREAGELAAAIVRGLERREEARTQSREARAASETARIELDDQRHSLGIGEAELRELRAALGQLTEQLQQHEMDLQRQQLELRHLNDKIRERFRGLELATAVSDYHARPQVDERHRARLRELGQLLDRMGSVNLDAMEQYEEQAKRYEYYSQQATDLSEALADLERAIARMNRESRRRFKLAFEGINQEFQRVFPRMFRGGKAELRLTDPSDLLETGIDILAQPPGKRLGHIELMSGGEKAFTAVSLLFAIFHFKPSPFCVLDEVDAPLDDANVDRYVEAIREMTDRSQFILITHSKRTMQSVDLLYGVTMQEPGVSKLVGVRVGAAQRDAALRSERTRQEADPQAAESAVA